MTRLRDRHGNTVEHVVTSAPQAVYFVVRDPAGYLIGRGMGDRVPPPTTPAELAVLGVDLATLVAP